MRRAATSRFRRGWGLLGVTLLMAGVALSAGTQFAGGASVGAGGSSGAPVHGTRTPFPVAEATWNLCPSPGGPKILGIEWDCVSVLNLTEVCLILVSIGIVAYVFRDSEWAELPGDSTEIAVTAEEWEEYRRQRSLQLRGEFDPETEREEAP